MLKLSYSKINDYLICPKRYELIHLLHLLPENNENIYSAFGSAIHYAIEQSINQQLDKIAAYAYFESKFNNLFNKIPLAQRQTIFKSEWISKGQEMLTYFFDKIFEKASKGKVETEYYFTYQIDKDTIFNGLIDLIFLTPEEKVELWDWKTGKKMKKEDNLQLRLYALFFQKATNLMPFKLNYIFLKSGSKNSTEVNLDTLKQTEQELNELIARIKKDISLNIFERNPQNNCKYCPVSKFCNEQLQKENEESQN